MPSIPVEIVSIADLTRTPKAEPKPEPPKPAPPKPEAAVPVPPAPEPPKLKTPPEPPKPTASPPPAPEPVPEPEKLAAKPEPIPEPLPVPKTEPPKPEPPKPVAKPKPPTPAAKKPEEKKPAEPDFASVLKNVAKLKTPAPETPPEPAKPQPQPPAPAAAPPPPSLETRLEASQLEAAIRQQVEQCWNVPAGARDAENLIVEIRVQLNPDGSVTDARIVDQSRLMTDLAFRAAAESARRAVLVCSPFKNLPAARYDVWRALTLRFDPKEMLDT
jgi:hypothetical protein